MIKLRYTLFVVLVLLMSTFGNSINADTDGDCFTAAYIMNILEQTGAISDDINYLMDNAGYTASLTMEIYLYKYGEHLADEKVLNDCLLPIHEVLTDYYENTIIVIAMLSTIDTEVDQELFVDTFLLFQAKREAIEERFMEVLESYEND